jgi:hypothetical protein
MDRESDAAPETAQADVPGGLQQGAACDSAIHKATAEVTVPTAIIAAAEKTPLW